MRLWPADPSVFPVKKCSLRLVLERWAGPCHDLSCGYDLARILFSSSRESLVRFLGLKFGCDVVDGRVNVELFAAENVHERMLVVWEGVNTDVAFGNDHEATDPPLCWIPFGFVYEYVWRGDLVHVDNIRKLVYEVVDARKVGEP